MKKLLLALALWPTLAFGQALGPPSGGTFPPIGCTTANGVIFNNVTPCDSGFTYAGMGGIITVGNGSQANPTIVGAIATTSGIWWPAAGSIAISIGGTTRLDYNNTCVNKWCSASNFGVALGGQITISDTGLTHGLFMNGATTAENSLRTLGANETLAFYTDATRRILIGGASAAEQLVIFGAVTAATNAFPALLRTGTSLGVRLGDNSGDAAFSAGNGTFSGAFINSGITTDATHTDATVCEDTTTHQFYSGSGTLGICLGTSGRQFKTAFEPMVAGLAEINAIPLWNYRYRIGYGDNGARLQFGSTAQDIEAIPALKVLVGHSQDGKAINYDMGALLPISLRAIQELDTKKADRDEITALRYEVEMLKRVAPVWKSKQ